ncbi:transcriptional regulator MraZ [Weissella muntiaci]|uniref:Transcriptional regulator MraZ n=1 Tax=Weissella muntiaci TaxID=2508881 RepID=A0A6C2CAR1_9LACO|nr:division/cell wall cluster transcriptional repressor MraZ [Weissella muntiaci]TYC50135.1 transcriptional regulator MraZ [Weissella muntiaci]
MFMGTFQHTLDTKNRLIVPAKFRNQLGETFVVTKWMENSLHAFTLEGWQDFSEKLNQLPNTNKDARRFRRFIYAGAVEAEFDKQGRISLPADLKEYAGILKDVTLFGNGDDSFEIWSAEKWTEYNSETADDFDDIASGLMDLGF